MNADCPHCNQPFTIVLNAGSSAPSTAASAGSVAAPPPSSAAPRKESRLEFLTRVREQSSYRVIRSLLGIIRDGGQILGVLCIIGGALMALFVASTGTFIAGALGLANALAACVGGLILIGLSLASYQAGIVVLDIADILIDEQTR